MIGSVLLERISPVVEAFEYERPVYGELQERIVTGKVIEGRYVLVPRYLGYEEYFLGYDEELLGYYEMEGGL